MKSTPEEKEIEDAVNALNQTAEIMRHLRFLSLHNKAWNLFGEDFGQVWLEEEVGTDHLVLHLRRADLSETKQEALEYAFEKIEEFNDYEFSYYVWRVVIL